MSSTRPTGASWASDAMVRLLAAVVLALGLANGAYAASTPEPPLRVLYLSQSVGFVHETVRRPADGPAPSERALIDMGRESGAFTVALSQDARDLTPARLTDYDVLVFCTTGALPIDQETWAAVVAWIESGRGGFVGVHNAADTSLAFEGGAEAYTAFLGGRFDGHPWTQGTPIRLSNDEPPHPLAAMWPDGTDYAEEIYQYAGFDPGEVRVLQSLDMSAGPLRRPYPVPVAWVREIGEGRLFYTNLGHTPSTWADPRFRTQLVEAIRWVGHRRDALATPNPAVQARLALKAFTDIEGGDAASSAAPGLEADIRALQGLHPDRSGVDPAAWDAARASIRKRLAR